MQASARAMLVEFAFIRSPSLAQLFESELSFFKYLLYWLVPNRTGWQSTCSALPADQFAWPWLLGPFAFVGYSLLIVIALWRGLRRDWLNRADGSMVAVSHHVRGRTYPEPFALYRSYLWALPGTLLAVFFETCSESSIIALPCGTIVVCATWGR
jgi:hypothetical protein